MGCSSAYQDRGRIKSIGVRPSQVDVRDPMYAERYPLMHFHTHRESKEIYIILCCSVAGVQQCRMEELKASLANDTTDLFAHSQLRF
jgi:hypothetical protein